MPDARHRNGEQDRMQSPPDQHCLPQPDLIPSGGTDEKRTAGRVCNLIRPAKVVTPFGEFLCVIRDVSETGISLRIFHPLPDCPEMLIEQPNGDRYAVGLVWQNSDRAGFRFTGEADMDRILTHPDRFHKRPIRVAINAPVELTAGVQMVRAELLDISQQGAKIACDQLLAIEQRVKIRAPGLRETRAKVRWRRNGFLGLAIDDTFQFEELARSVCTLHQSLGNLPRQGMRI